MSDLILLRRADEMLGLLSDAVRQIRVPVKPQPVLGKPWKWWVVDPDVMDLPTSLSPFGQPGDRLLCKEPWCPCDDGPAYLAAAMNKHGEEDTDIKRVREEYGYKWHSAATMPRWAVRCVLVVDEIKVERVQEATEEDRCREINPIARWATISIEHHQRDWDARYPRYPWASNPWTWVATVKRETT